MTTATARRPRKRGAKKGDDNGPRTAPALVPVEKIHPHPDNRDVSVPGCEGLAESFKRHGQQQPIKVRRPGPRWKLPAGHYQIVFGERRWQAAQIAGWKTVRAECVELSDEETLELIATENGQRADLNDIERARLIERLIQPVADGGADKTVAEAAARMGIAESTARNLMRVAALPKYWTDQIVSGEMESSKLRPIARYRECKPVMKLLEEAYKEDHGTGSGWGAGSWGTRELIEESCQGIVESNTCALTPEDLFEHEGWHTPEFDAEQLTAAQRKKLQVVDVPTGANGQTKRRCFNQKLWRDLQEKARSQETNGRKKAAEKSKPKLTPAQQKAKAKEAADKLQRSIDSWRLAWLRRCCAASLTPAAWQVTMLLTWLAYGRCWQLNEGHRQRAVNGALGAHGVRTTSDMHKLFQSLAKVDPRPANHLAVACDSVRALLDPGALELGSDERIQTDNLPVEVIEDLARYLDIDVANTWEAAQRGTARPALWSRFFELHNKEQLEKLAGQLKVNLFGKRSKSEMVKAFAAQSKPLALPKSVKPLRKAKGK